MAIARHTLLILLLLLAPAGAAEFSFLHLSDVHTPIRGSRETIAAARECGPIRLAPYNVTAPAPSFAIVTGDLTEFGGGNGAWETYQSYWEGVRYPVYSVPGNHDNTWWLLRPALRAQHGGLPYAFRYGGCHFIGLDTAGRQDPRPALALEELQWLRAYLKRVPKRAPLFLFFHHPLAGSEWATPYDYERLFAILRPYNVVLLLVGHGHSAVAMKLGGFDAVEGGTTFDQRATPPSTGNAGFNVIAVQGDMVRVAYRRTAEAEATLGLLEKPLVAPAPLPEPRFAAPRDNARVAADQLTVRVRFAGGPEVAGQLALDGGDPVPLTRRGSHWEATLDLTGADPGRHVLRTTFKQGEQVAVAAREFSLERPGGPRARWRTALGTSVRAALAVAGGRVYAAGQNGVLTALEAANGKVRWRFATGGEILGGPAVAGDTILVASTNGSLYALSREGKERWRYDAGAPIVAPPVADGAVVAVGALDGSFHCVDQATGQARWVSREASYTIESAACLAGDTFFFGAWDTFVYALSARDGSLRWKTPAEGTRRAAARYYSPADSPVAVVGGRVFAADRHMTLTVFDAATGECLSSREGCAAVAPAADGSGVYLRVPTRSGPLVKVDPEGNEVWRRDAGLGYLPSVPFEDGGIVAAATSTGRVSAIAAADGRLLWQYRVTPGLYLPGGAVPAGEMIYAAGLDGFVTAVGM